MPSSPHSSGLQWNAQALSASRVRFTVTVPEDMRRKAEESAVQALAKTLSLKGFRPGTVPPELARKHVGEDKVLEEVIHALAPDIIRILLEEEKRRPVIAPALSLESVDPLTLGILFVEEPEAKVKKIDTSSLKKGETKVDDKDVERVVEQFLKDMRSETSVDREARTGDTVVADFWGEDEAGQEIPGTRSEGYRIEVGSKTLIPGFEDGVTGIKKNETKDIALVFPEKYQAEHLRGKPATFHVTAKEILEVTRPTLTRELLKERIGADKDPEEFRAEIRRSLVEQEERMGAQDRQHAFLEAVRSATTVDLPPELIDAELRSLLGEFEHRLSQQQLTIRDWLASSGKTAEDLEKDMREAAVRRLTTQCGMRALIKKDKIELTEEERAEARRSLLEGAPEQERASLEAELKEGTARYEQMQWNASVKKLMAKYAG